MLYSPYVCGFGALYDNFGATITETGIGTSVPASATVNQKSATVQLIAAATIVEHCYGIGILFTGGATSAAAKRYLVDIMYDPAGGTNWQVLIPNLYSNSPSLIAGGYKYFFPIRIPAGSSLGARTQCSVASGAMRVAVQLYGNPSRPELVKFGTYVEAFGVVESTTSGTALTPGNAVIGAYASIGTTAKDLWWWQWGGIGTNDTTMGAFSQQGDVAVGDATFKKTCVDNCIQVNTAAEQSGKDAFGFKIPVRLIPAGSTVWVRSAGSGAADTTPTTTAYGMG
jgi:hypothetical protein